MRDREERWPIVGRGAFCEKKNQGCERTCVF